METTLNSIRTALKKLEEGTLNTEELDQFVKDSQELYEKALIIRYKAYEEKIFGVKAVSDDQIQTVPEVEQNEIVTETFASEETDKAIEENFNIEEKESVGIEFSLFEDEDEEEEEMEEVGLEDEGLKIAEERLMTNDEDIAREEIRLNTEFLEEEEAEPEVPMTHQEDVVEHISTTTTHDDHLGVHIDKTVTEQTTLTPSSESNIAFLEKFGHVDADEVQQVTISRLSTLVGAFGLNERLQCINELFGGSSEAFSDAIKAVDHVGSFSEAILVTSEFANQYAWDLESETVDEFIFKIKRRYA